MTACSENNLTLKRVIYGYIAYLIISAAFARKALVFLRNELGVRPVRGIPWFLFAATLAVVVIFILKQRIPWLRLLLVLLSFLGIYFYMKTMHISEERIHIFQYGLLGFLLVILNREKPWWVVLILSVAIVVGVAGADELFQAFLPDRVGDIRVGGFGFLGGVWGILIAGLVTRKKNPLSEV